MGNPASFVTAASTDDVNTFTQAQTFSAGIAYGCRAFLGFGVPNFTAGSNANPVLSTPQIVHWCGVSTLGDASFVAPRAGCIRSITANLTANAAGSTAIFAIYKNGVLLNAACVATVALGQNKASATFASGLYTFAAGDIFGVGLLTGSGWTPVNCDASCAVEVEV